MITTVHVNINKDNRHCHGMYITMFPTPLTYDGTL